jgi:hypothetical protein
MPAITSHQLALEIPHTPCPDRMRIIDASVYADAIAVECETLEILIPGYIDPVVFKDTDTPTPLDGGFDRWFTTVDLGLQAGGSSSLACLPDGLYTIQYSVSPNDEKYVKYYHLRTTQAMNDYYKELCKIQLAECEPTAEVKQHLADLRYIKMLLDSAKAKAEFCHAPDQASAMLQYANKLMKKYQDGCCVTCS